MKDGRQNKNAPSESRPNAIPRTTMLYPVAKDCDDTHIVEIESLCWEGVDVDGEALGAVLFEGDGAAKLDAEERTSMGAYVNGTEEDHMSGNTAT